MAVNFQRNIQAGNIIDAEDYNEIANAVNKIYHDDWANNLSSASEIRFLDSHIRYDSKILDLPNGFGNQATRTFSILDQDNNTVDANIENGNLIIVFLNDEFLERNGNYSLDYGNNSITFFSHLSNIQKIEVYNRTLESIGWGQLNRSPLINTTENFRPVVSANSGTSNSYIRSNTNGIIDKVNLMLERVRPDNVDIEDIILTNGDPVKIVTDGKHYFENNDKIILDEIIGTTELNDNFYNITKGMKDVRKFLIDKKITINYAKGYTHNSGTLTSENTNDFGFGSGEWTGGFTIGNNVWLIDDNSNDAIIYINNNGKISKNYKSINDLDLGSGEWNGGFAIGNNVWLIDNNTNYARGYTHNNGTLTSENNNDVSLGSGLWTGGFAINDNVWFIDDTTKYARGYTHSSGTLTRASDNDVSLEDTGWWRGGFAINDNVWFVNNNSDEAVGYTHSSGTLTRASSNDISLGSGSWRDGFAIGDNVWFIDENANQAEGYTHSSGTLTRASSNDLDLGSGEWRGGFSIGDNVWFMDNDDDDAIGYTHTNGSLNKTDDLDLGSGEWTGGFAIINPSGDNVWFINDNANQAVGYTHSSGILTRESSNDLDLGSGEWRGGFSVDNYVWFLDNNSDEARGYTQLGGTLDRASAFDLDLGSGEWTGGFSIGNNVWFINDETNQAVGYTHSIGTLTRASGNDINLGSGEWKGGFATDNYVWFMGNNLSENVINIEYNGSNFSDYTSGGTVDYNLNIIYIDLIENSDIEIQTEINHNLETGDNITITNVEGTTELNGNEYTITKINNNKFSLDGTSSGTFTDYDGGGIVTISLDISDIILTNNNPVEIEVSRIKGHSLKIGDIVSFTNVGGTTQLNSENYIISIETEDNSFTLNDTSYDGSNFTPYIDGGNISYLSLTRANTGDYIFAEDKQLIQHNIQNSIFKSNYHNNFRKTMLSGISNNIRTVPWQSKIDLIWRWVFDDYNHCRYYFNSGGEISCGVSIFGNSNPSENDGIVNWEDAISTAGNISMNYIKTMNSNDDETNVISENIGFYNLSTEWQTISRVVGIDSTLEQRRLTEYNFLHFPEQIDRRGI